MVPGWGFLLNNELTDFNFDSTTHPNRADSRKRPRSSMAPTIVTRHGKPFLAVGSPGGSTIIGTVAQVLVDRIDLAATLPVAIANPRAVERNGATSTAEPAFIASPEGQTLQSQYRHVFTPTGRDRRGHGPRVPVSRQGARRCRAGPSGRRQRGGGASLAFRRVRIRPAVALACLATVVAADWTIRRRRPRWIVVGLLDEPAHLATAGLVLVNLRPRSTEWAAGFMAGAALPDLDHIPLALSRIHPSVDDPRPVTHCLLAVAPLFAAAHLARPGPGEGRARRRRSRSARALRA